MNSSGVLHKWFYVFLATGVFINATGLFSYILEPDGALYADIAKHIAITNDWINLYGNGSDWLDKPHFPFWITALSFKLFGISSFTYKLPAFIFWLAGIYILYLFIKQTFNANTAKLAVLIYTTAAHSVISNFDVRAEPYLTTVMLGALYFLYRFQKTRELKNIVWAALFTAASIMTKGIFILIPLAGSFIFYWIKTKQGKEFTYTAWYVYLLLVSLFILPELYCLYVQFDIHPEKIIYGQSHVSGLRFFFWDSQFGRFFNTGPIKGTGNPLFFLHTILWAFLPWTIVLCLSIYQLFFKAELQNNKERLLIFYSALITFLLFSFSGFQLPHYIIIIFPQLAAISANYLTGTINKPIGILIKIQSGIFYLCSATIVALTLFYNMDSKWLILLLIVFINVVIVLPFDNTPMITFLKKSFCISLLVHLFFNLFFYPELASYQAGMQAAEWSNKQKKNYPIAMYLDNSSSLEFYSNNHVNRISSPDSLKKYMQLSRHCLIYTSDINAQKLQQQGIHMQILKQFNYYPISKLNLTFINYNTRALKIKKVDLVQCSINTKPQNF